LQVLTYPQWKLNRQIAIGVAVLVVIIAAVVWWRQSDADKRAEQV
jgi:glucose uptake protein GlcU